MRISNRNLERHLAAKLRITAAALGCTSRKDFCNRFHAVNPATICVLDRLHKWLQARASPRSAQFYDDWSRVVGSQRPGSWFAGCSIEALLAELVALFDADPQMLLQAEPLGPPSGIAPQILSSDDPMAFLAGTYVCYSYSWSPYYRGKMVRSSLSLTPTPNRQLAIIYNETLAGRIFRFEGIVVQGAGAVVLPVIDPVSRVYLCMTLFTPRPPVSVLCGMLSGVTVLDHEPRPSASRFVAARLPVGHNADGTNRYLEVTRRVFSNDLRCYGFPVDKFPDVDPIIQLFLDTDARVPNISQIPASQQVELVGVFDQFHLAEPEVSNELGGVPSPNLISS
jgi:hypothetical protein